MKKRGPFFIILALLYGIQTSLTWGRDLDLDLLDQLDMALESKGTLGSEPVLESRTVIKSKVPVTAVEDDRKDYSKLLQIEDELAKIQSENAKLSAEFTKLSQEILIRQTSTRFVRIKLKVKDVAERILANLDVRINGSQIAEYEQAEISLLEDGILIYEGPMVQGPQRLDVGYKVYHKNEKGAIQMHQFQDDADFTIDEQKEFVVHLQIGEQKNELAISEKAI